MKKITKSLVLSTGSLLLLGAPIALAISCGSGGIATSKISANHFEYYSNRPELQVGHRIIDINRSGNDADTFIPNVVGALGRITTTGEYEYTVNDDGTFNWVQTPERIIKLQLASSIELQTASGSVIDTIDSANVAEKLVGNTTIPDPVANNLDRAVFNLKDVEWVDYNGEGTGNKLSNKDFVYGMIKSFASEKAIRDGAEGSSESSASFADLQNIFGVDAEFRAEGYSEKQFDLGFDLQNAYIWDLLGVDFGGTLQLNFDLWSEGITDKFVVQFTETAVTQLSANTIKDLLVSYMKGGSIGKFFFPIDSTFTEATARANNDDSIAALIGYYDYGISPESVHSVGAYYFNTFNVLTKATLFKNKLFVDQEWANDDVNTITSITVNYANFDATTRNAQLQSLYNQGRISSFNLNLLTTDERSLFISANSDKIKYSQASTTSDTGILRQPFYNSIPAPHFLAVNDPDWSALMGYDSDSDNQAAFFEEGTDFRRILHGAINPYAWAKSFGSDYVPNRTIAQIGFDINIDGVLEPLIEQGDVESIGYPAGELPDSVLKAAYESATTEEQKWRSPAFEDLKTEFSSLLDNYFANNAQDGEKFDNIVNIKISNSYTSLTTAPEIIALEEYKKVLEDLDSRLKVDVVTAKNTNDRYRMYAIGAEIASIYLWGNDFKQVHSTLVGYLQSYQAFISMLKYLTTVENGIISATFTEAEDAQKYKIGNDLANFLTEELKASEIIDYSEITFNDQQAYSWEFTQADANNYSLDFATNGILKDDTRQAQYDVIEKIQGFNAKYFYYWENSNDPVRQDSFLELYKYITDLTLTPWSSTRYPTGTTILNPGVGLPRLSFSSNVTLSNPDLETSFTGIELMDEYRVGN